MTDTAAASTAPATTAPAPAAESAAAESTEAQAVAAEPPQSESERKQQLLDLSTLDPETPVRMVVNGREQTIKARDAISRLQRGESATQRYQEAARLRQEAEDRAASLTKALSDPSQFRRELLALGMSPRELAERVLQQELEEQALSPEEKRHRQLREEIERMEAAREQERQRTVQAQAQQYRAGYEQLFHEQMDAAGIPKANRIRATIGNELAAYFSAKVQNGEKVSRSELRAVAQQVHAEMVGDWRTQMSDEERRALLRDDDIAWYQQRKAASVPQVVPPARAPNPDQGHAEDGRFMAKNEKRVVREGDWDNLFRR